MYTATQIDLVNIRISVAENKTFQLNSWGWLVTSLQIMLMFDFLNDTVEELESSPFHK